MLISAIRQLYKYCILQDPDHPFPVKARSIPKCFKKAQTILGSHIRISYLAFPILQHLTLRIFF